MTRQSAAAVRGCRVEARSIGLSAVETLESRVLLATVPTGFQDQVYSMGYTAPTSMEFAPDGRLFVSQQGGQLRLHLAGQTSPSGTPFLTVQTTSSGERGLLSVTLDPSFMSNGYVYVYYTALSPTTHNRISRFKAIDADPGPAYLPGNTADPNAEGQGVREKVLMDLETLGATNHNGGAMHFGPDGKLYIAVGENAVPSHSQTLNNRLGKMLRINPDGTIPTDNPFYNQASGDNRAIWALGLRNPYTFAFQPGTGRMFINDVGQSSFEEVNDGVAGSNYGWPNVEGYRGTQTVPGPGTYRDPVVAYGRTVGQTVAGGAFYNPPVPNFPPQYVGQYFLGDYMADWVRYINPSVNRPPINNFASGVNGAVDLDVGADGMLYHLAINTGTVGRITWAAPVIRTQPQPQTATEGQPATFEVTATGVGALGYQWRRNGANIPNANQRTYTTPPTTADDDGARYSVVVTNTFGSATSDDATLTVVPVVPAPAVVGRHVFYNDSAFDGRSPDANVDDDRAIAPDKAALLPGQKASFSNVTSYSRGINGLMVDIANLPGTVTITGANFAFATGKGDGKWAEAPAPALVTLRRGAGAQNSDRVTVTWADNRIVNRWLRVTVSPGAPVAGTGPVNHDVFYFANLRGEVGDVSKIDPSRLTVSVSDQLATRRAMYRGTAPLDSDHDHNRDGRVNVLDYAISARNRGQWVNLMTAGPPPTAAVATAAGRVSDEVLK